MPHADHVETRRVFFIAYFVLIDVTVNNDSDIIGDER